MDKYQADVLIIGAGAVGTALARELSKYSLKIIVVDRLNDVGGDASKSNSAIVHTGFDAPPGSLESEMVVSSNPMWDKLCSDLDIPFKRVGAILVALTEQEEAELPGILEKARKNRVYDLDRLTPAQIRDLEGDVSEGVRAGILVPRESITDPFLLVVALAENACANGVKFLVDCEIRSLVAEGGGYRAESENASIHARYVVNAAGLFSDRISGFLGIQDFKMHPRRGQFHIIDREAPLRVQRIILPVPTKITKGKLLAPTIHGNWLSGPTAEELEDKTDASTNRQGLDEVMEGVRKLVPGLHPRQAITQYAGLRPVRTPDGYNVRNFDHLPGYLEISGIRSTGISASLALARYAANRLADMGVALQPRNDFIATREGIPCFRDAGPEERQALMDKDPRYGNVICRCETVTEAEIVQAIHRQPGARDVDGIKRRVRAGLGRCQAGFCGMRVPGILARELGIELTGVTKKGKGSELLVGRTKSLRKD
jgi:glycerol-3-phosphate dehydrogenase